MALISDLPNATPQKSDLMEIQNGQTSSNNSSVGQLMQLSASENLAPAYDASAGVYAVGDFVSYNGTLYRCNTAIATPEAFDATKWTAKKVVDMTGSDIAVSDSVSTSIAAAIDAIPLISYEDLSGTTGTTQYAGYYYVNVTKTATGYIIGALVIDSTSNRLAFCQRISATTIRAYTPVADTTVTVRVLLLN